VQTIVVSTLEWLDPDPAPVIDIWPVFPESLRRGLARWSELPEAIRAVVLALFGFAGRLVR
jgi:hypothetical protein